MADRRTASLQLARVARAAQAREDPTQQRNDSGSSASASASSRLNGPGASEIDEVAVSRASSFFGWERVFGEIASAAAESDEVVEEMRKRFQRFLKSLIEILGRCKDGAKRSKKDAAVPKAVLHEVGSGVYRALARSSKGFVFSLNEPNARVERRAFEEIQRVLGPFVSLQDCSELLVDVSSLEHWRLRWYASHGQAPPNLPVPADEATFIGQLYHEDALFCLPAELAHSWPGPAHARSEQRAALLSVIDDAGYDAAGSPLEDDLFTNSRTTLVKRKRAAKRWDVSQLMQRATATTDVTGPPVVSELPDRGSSSYWDAVRGASVYGMSWLSDQCDAFIMQTPSLSDAGMTSSTLATSIEAALKSSNTDAALQEELFNLVGYEGFELVSLVLEKRGELVTLWRALASVQEDAALREHHRSLASDGKVGGASVSIRSESAIQLEKLQRKQDRKLRRRVQAAERQGDVNWSEMRRQRGQELAQRSAIQDAVRSGDTSVLNLAAAGTLSTEPIQSRGVRTEGAIRTETQEYEMVSIPPRIAPAIEQTGERLVPITAFSKFSQDHAFSGIESLNRIQSRLFPAAYHSDENLLVCAPTGAGKTNCAMMAVARELEKHLLPGSHRIDPRAQFKIVYVAPMKALAAEMADNFSKRVSSAGIKCRELTGDMQLTRRELEETHIIVTTPEKWDVITRKSGDVALTSSVRLLIIDEVHLLHEERGPVIEVLVARTLRQVESSQSLIRIVGLSATLPNYKDVALFLRVNPQSGLFHFDNSYRPVPLAQQFIGIKARGSGGASAGSADSWQAKAAMTSVCYERVLESVAEGNQVMVFVHARAETVRTARALIELAKEKGTLPLFEPGGGHGEDFEAGASHKGKWAKDILKAKSKELKELFTSGFAVHHAGLLRPDRSLVERIFKDGGIRVLCCTATLAWGVNLPAHTVVIKGTQIYDASAGKFVELGMLDVMQIFGRAGRPQFDTSGEGIIITTNDKLPRYLQLLNHALPIESQLQAMLPDHLNAEIVLGTVSNITEAVMWLSYTYLFVRILRNPLMYGVSWHEREADPHLVYKRREWIVDAARRLDGQRMIRFDMETGSLSATALGRTASHFYLKHASVRLFNEALKPEMTDAEILATMASSEEFANVKVREDEAGELQAMEKKACHVHVKGAADASSHGKVATLLQAHLSHMIVDSFSLASDMAHVVQNGGRILRGLFDIVLKKGWASTAARLLQWSLMLEHRMWDHRHPLWQFAAGTGRGFGARPKLNTGTALLSAETLQRLDSMHLDLDRLADMSSREIAQAISSNPQGGQQVAQAVARFPYLEVESRVQPITRGILRVELTLYIEFEWFDRVHGSVEPWHIWVVDPESDYIYHSETLLVHKREAVEREPQHLVFTIPVHEPIPGQYLVRIMSDRWLGAESVTELSFRNLVLPRQHPPHTELLDLQPLPRSALQNPAYEKLYSFSHFNPVQTQVFHTLFYTDENALIGAPTGSGKTAMGELAMLRVFRDAPNLKVVYVGPLKALVRERVDDWEKRLAHLGKKVVELTGDVTPDLRSLQRADVLITTPEKWDGVSRNWQHRSYVKRIALVILDEVHLLGTERGAILEVIVSRMRLISERTQTPCRFVALSTALANAQDLGDWLGVNPRCGLFNFRPAVRPVPLEVHIAGFPGRHYCPRMQTMNRPTFQAIQQYSPEKPVLVFVSSRRQTRLTAMDLVNYATSAETGVNWIRMPAMELDAVISTIRDTNLRQVIQFGVGLHHSGLTPDDKKIVETLFRENKIQVLVTTSTLAWGVNLPAHLVVVKGTEFYDAKTSRYIDFPVTDVLQMMGRAGRPQFDTQAVAVILVEESKKNFYKRFLYEPFPVESSLPEQLADHLNAEIAGGTISTLQEAIDYLTWTYFFRRIVMNPAYYGVADSSNEAVGRHLSTLVDNSVSKLAAAGCVAVDTETAERELGIPASASNTELAPTVRGRLASFYYLKYQTIHRFAEDLQPASTIPELLDILTRSEEFSELPVRHNEDMLNEELSRSVPWKPRRGVPQGGVAHKATVATADEPTTISCSVSDGVRASVAKQEENSETLRFDSPHVKAHLLLQAHFERAKLPIADYVTDTKSVLDQSMRVVQAMVDAAADAGWLQTTLNSMYLAQMIVQGMWAEEADIRQLPFVSDSNVNAVLARHHIDRIADAVRVGPDKASAFVVGVLRDDQLKRFRASVAKLPLIDFDFEIGGNGQSSDGSAGTADIGTASAASSGQARVCSVIIGAATQIRVRFHDRRPGSALRQAYAPRFSKKNDEGWWIVLGDERTGELIAIRRIRPGPRAMTSSLSFNAPSAAGQHEWTLFLVSNCYLGLDQQLPVHLQAEAAAPLPVRQEILLGAGAAGAQQKSSNT